MAGKKRMAKWVGGRVGPTGYKLILIGTQASLTAAGLCISFSFFFSFLARSVSHDVTIGRSSFYIPGPSLFSASVKFKSLSSLAVT